eukprot:SAG11_NODE_32_length_22830_cov_17.507941_6_plen_137_part_00
MACHHHHHHRRRHYHCGDQLGAVSACWLGRLGGGLLASLFWGCFTVGRLLGIPVSLRFSPETILRADLLLALPSAGGMLLFGEGNPAVLWLGTAIFGLSMACTCAHCPAQAFSTGALRTAAVLEALFCFVRRRGGG